MKINDINESVLALSGFVPRALLDNEYWKIFGFKSRPKRGKFFRKFVDKSKLAIEDFLEKELMMLSMFDVVKAIKDSDTSDDIKNVYLTAVLSELFLPLKQSGFFVDDLDYLNFVKDGVFDYSRDNIVDAFQKRESKYLPNMHTNSLFIGIVMFASINSDHLNQGFTLDRNILSGYVIPLDPKIKYKFPLTADKVEIYSQFAIDILKLI